MGILGCSLMGAPTVGLIASFPTVKERVNHWEEELVNHKVVTDALLSILVSVWRLSFPTPYADQNGYCRLV